MFVKSRVPMQLILLLFVNIGFSRAALLLDPCERETDCPAGSSCVWRDCDGQRCICDNALLPNEDRTQCFIGTPLEEPCNKTDPCLGGPFSHCDNGGNNTCQCKDSYHLSLASKMCIPNLYKGERSLELGEECVSSNECVFDLSCVEGKCQCGAGQRLATDDEMAAEPESFQLCRPKDFKLGVEVDVSSEECQMRLKAKQTTTTTTTSTSTTSSTTTTTTTTSTTQTPSTTTPTITTPTTTTSTSTTSSTTSATTTPTTTTAKTTSTSTTSRSATTTSSTTSSTTTSSSTAALTTSTTTPSTTSSTKPTTTTTSITTQTPTSKTTNTPTTTSITSTSPSTTPTTPIPSKPSSKTLPSPTIIITPTPQKQTTSNTEPSPSATTTQDTPSSGPTISPWVTKSTTQPPSNATTDYIGTTIIYIDETTTASVKVPETSESPGTKSPTTPTTTDNPFSNVTVELGGECDKQKCQEHAECVKDVCDVARCRCILGYAPSPDNTECWKLSALGEVCTSQRICQGANTQCAESGVCECKDEYERSDNGRWCRLKTSWFVHFPVVGEECSAGFFRHCYMDHEQECVEGHCRCMEGLRPLSDLDKRAVYPGVAQCRDKTYTDGGRDPMLCGNQSRDNKDSDAYKRAKAKIHKVQGAIIGGCVGFVAFLGIVIGIIALIRWKRRGRREMIRDTSSTASTDGQTSRYSFKIPRPFTHFVGSKEYDSSHIAYPNSMFDGDNDNSGGGEPKPDLVKVGTLGRDAPRTHIELENT